LSYSLARWEGKGRGCLGDGEGALPYLFSILDTYRKPLPGEMKPPPPTLRYY